MQPATAQGEGGFVGFQGSRVQRFWGSGGLRVWEFKDSSFTGIGVQGFKGLRV